MVALLLVLVGCPRTDPYAEGVIDLPRTGQTTSYTTGDDGDLRFGVAWPSPRFTDNGDGTVSDALTGLMWYEDGDFLDVAWGDAIADVGSRTFAGYDDWRVPNLVELRSLLNAGQAIPSTWLNGLGFNDVQPAYYWTSTTCASDTTRAYAVRMDTGNTGGYPRTVTTQSVLAVRGQSVGAAVELP